MSRLFLAAALFLAPLQVRAETPAPSQIECPETLKRTSLECKPYRKARILALTGWIILTLSVPAFVTLAATGPEHAGWGRPLAVLPFGVVGLGMGIAGEYRAKRRRVVTAFGPGGFALNF